MKKSSWWTVVLIFAFQTSAWALSPLNQYFNLVAGEGEAGFRDGDFSNALFKHPTDVAASEDGELLFVADRDNHRIRCVLLSGKNSVITLAGTGVAGRQDGDFTTATFNAPSNLALLPGRRLLVYDSGDGSFRLIFLEKQKVITIPAPDMKQAQGIALTGLYGMVYDPETHFLYFSQPDSQTLRRLDVESGVFETVLEKNDKIPNPYALCLYKKHLCVADRNLPAVFQVEFQVDTPTATPTPTAGGTPAVPAAPAGSAAPAPSLPVSLTQVAMGDHVVSMTENDGILYAFQAADVAWIRLTSTDKIPSGEVKFMSIWAPYLEPKTPALDALMSFKDSANAPALSTKPGSPREFYWVSPVHQQVFALKDYLFFQYKETKKETYPLNPNGLTDYSYPEKKDPHCYRILILGDSRVFYENERDPRWTWGGFNRQETFPKKLEFALNLEAALRDSPIHFEVLTFGQYRWEGPPYWWPTYRVPELVKKFDVDTVMMLMPNDLDLGVWFERPITKEGIPQAAVDSEYSVKHMSERLVDQPSLREFYDRCLWKNWVSMDRDDFPVLGTLATDEKVLHGVEGLVSKPLAFFVSDLKKAEVQLGHSVPFNMIFVPLGSVGSPFNAIEPYRNLYREVCRKTGIRWLDLTEPWTALKISGYPTSEFWYMHHFDYNGHTLLTYLWTHLLIEQHLIPLGGEATEYSKHGSSSRGLTHPGSKSSRHKGTQPAHKPARGKKGPKATATPVGTETVKSTRWHFWK